MERISELKQAAQIKSFGRNVRRERMAKKITQEKLAELVDLNIRTVRRSGKAVNILLTTVLRLHRRAGL